MYEVVDSPDYKAALKKLGLSSIEEEHIFEGISWTLYRDPEAGMKYESDSGISMFILFFATSLRKDVAVTYHFEDQLIVLDNVVWDETSSF